MDRIIIYIVLAGVAISTLVAIINTTLAMDSVLKSKKTPWKIIVAGLGFVPVVVYKISDQNITYTAISLIFGLVAIIMFFLEMKKR